MHAILPLLLAAPAGAASAETASNPSQARVKREAADRFMARYSLRGKSAQAVIETLEADRFACWLEWRRTLPEDRGEPAASRRLAVLYCSRWDPRDGVPCLEERILFDIDWRNPRAEGEALVPQLGTSPVVGETYTCVPSRSARAVEEPAKP